MQTDAPNTASPSRPRWGAKDCEMQEPTPKKSKADAFNNATPRRPLRDVTNAQSPRRRRPTPKPVEKKPATAAPQAATSDAKSPPLTPIASVIESRPQLLAKEELLLHSAVNEKDDTEAALATSIYQQIRRVQMHKRVLTDYLDDQAQPEVNAKMRSILVDWLTEVHYRLNLDTETLFLAVNYLDRFLEVRMALRKELQLVGLACLFIASKCEEVDPIAITDLVYVCDKTYTIDQIIQMERQILDALQFDLVVATSHGFLQYLCDALAASKHACHRAGFILHHTLLHLPVLIAFSPVELAAASLYAGQCLETCSQQPPEWIQALEATTELAFDAVGACVHDLYLLLHQTSSKLAAVRYKFGTKRFGRVAHGPIDVLTAFIPAPCADSEALRSIASAHVKV